MLACVFERLYRLLRLLYLECFRRTAPFEVHMNNHGQAGATAPYRNRAHRRSLLASLCRGSVLFLSWVFLATCFSAGDVIAEPKSIVLRESSVKTRGQIALVNLNGEAQIRLTGFVRPTGLYVTARGDLAVIDIGTREIYLISNLTGVPAISQIWKMTQEISDPIGAYPNDSGEIVIADRRKGITVIAADSTSRFIAYPLDPQEAWSSSTILPDQRIAVVRGGAPDIERSVFVAHVRDSSWSPLTFANQKYPQQFIPNGIAAVGSSVYVWRSGAGGLLEGTIDHNSFNVTRVIESVHPHLVTSSGPEGLFVADLVGSFSRLVPPTNVNTTFRFINQPFSIAWHPSANLLAVAYEYPLEKSWPEDRNELLFDRVSPFPWKNFLVWFGVSLIATIGWIYLATRGSRFDNESLHPSSESEVASRRQPMIALLGLFLPLVAYGLYLAWGAQKILSNTESHASWVLSYLGGASLVAVCLEIWRRLYPTSDEPKLFTSHLKATPPPFSAWYYPPLAVAIGLSGWVLTMGFDPSFIGLRESVVCAALLSLFSIVVIDMWRCRQALRSFTRNEWMFFTPALVVGLVTFFYKLETVPYNTHFDLTLHAFAGGQYLRGCKLGAWDWGYTPAPVIGTLPDILALAIAGFTPLGYRIGNSVLSLSALFAVYLLARTYRNPRTGMWAALILAGNIPMIHFGRLNNSGAAATIALWALTAFVLALKYKRPSLWVCVGLIGGFAFYQWPVARVGITACGLAYLLVFVRYPLRQLRNVPHMLCGLAAVCVLLAPMILMWIEFPNRFLPRSESLSVISWQGAQPRLGIQNPTVQLLLKSFAWALYERDQSTQGTLSPAFNSIEAVLFACGWAILLIEGLSINILFVVYMFLVMLICGAWAVGTPWYTRLLPSAPIVCILIARALEGFNNLFVGRKRLFSAVFMMITVGVLVVSPWQNFLRYVAHETSANGRYNARPMSAIARALREIGPEHPFLFLPYGEATWQFANLANFGEMLPYIDDLHLREVYDLENELPVPAGQTKRFVVQLQRRSIDVPVIQRFHPQAIVQELKDLNNKVTAILVTAAG